MQTVCGRGALDAANLETALWRLVSFSERSEPGSNILLPNCKQQESSVLVRWKNYDYLSHTLCDKTVWCSRSELGLLLDSASHSDFREGSWPMTPFSSQC